MKVFINSHSSINALVGMTTQGLPDQLRISPEGLRRPCLEPDYKAYITDSGSRRRMSRAVKMGVAAAMHCLSQTEAQPDAIITATGLGCLGDTEKFLKTLIDNGEELLNPTPFIQSTFNTVGAQVAMILKNKSYNITYVHRGFSFEHTLLDAWMQLNEQEAQHILIGSYEETTDTSFHIMERLGFWRNGTLAGEGAQFFMLSTKEDKGCELKGILPIFKPQTEDISAYLIDFLGRHQLQTQDIDLLVTGENKPDSYYQAIEQQLPEASIACHKHLTGDYQTASSLALWLSVQLMQTGHLPSYLAKRDARRPIRRILVYNHFLKNHSFILLEKTI